MSDYPYTLIAAAFTQTGPRPSEQKGGGESARGSHRLASVRECQRYWWLRYGQGIKQVGDAPEKEHLTIGTLVHLYLAYYYAQKMLPVPEPFASVSIDDAISEIVIGRPDLVRQSVDISEAYILRDGYSTWTPHSVEREFVATIGQLDPDGPDHTLNDEVVTCRADLIVENQGQLWIVDHKTVGRGWKGKLPSWNQETNDYCIPWQAMVYLHIIRQHLPISGLIINRIKRTPPYDFDRHVLDMPPLAYAQTPRAIREAVRLEKEITFNAQNGVMPIPNLSACYKRYGQCDYIKVCSAHTPKEQQRLLGGT